MKVNVFNIVSLLFFLLNPILGLISSLISLYKSRKSYLLCFIYSMFVAISISKNEIYADSLTYNQMYNEVALSDLKEIDGYITYKIISYYFKELSIPYEVLPFLHVLLMVLFLTKSLVFLSDKYNFTGKKFILSLIGLTILANPVVASMGQRNSLAIFIVIYAIILFSSKRLYFSVFLLVMASAIHFVMIIFIPLLILSKNINLDKIKYFFSVLFACIGSLFFDNLIKLFTINDGVQDFTAKYQEINYDLGTAGVFIYNITLYFMKLVYFLIFLRYAFFENKDIFLRNLRNFILVLTIFCFFLIQNPVAFGRFTTYLVFLIFIYINTYSSKYYVGNSVKYFLIISCISYFVFYNIFPWREVIFKGDIHLALLFPSFYTILDLFS